MIQTNEFATEHAPFDPDGVSFDPAGRLWVVRTPPTRDPVTIDVFDRRRGRVASVALPSGRTLLAVGARHLYAVARDELDLETLERYEIPIVP